MFILPLDTWHTTRLCISFHCHTTTLNTPIKRKQCKYNCNKIEFLNLDSISRASNGCWFTLCPISFQTFVEKKKNNEAKLHTLPKMCCKSKVSYAHQCKQHTMNKQDIILEIELDSNPHLATRNQKMHFKTWRCKNIRLVEYCCTTNKRGIFYYKLLIYVKLNDGDKSNP
jgi:hypothetical protein